MRAASKSRGTATILVRLALWFCACNVLAAVVAAQCTNPTQAPTGTYTTGDHSASDNNALADANLVLSGSATATFVAGNCIDLQPGFHTTAGTAATTFHAWVETAPSVISAAPTSGTGLSQPFTWIVSSPAGYSNLSDVMGLFNTVNTPATGANACYIRYNRASNLLYLADNGGANWLGGFAPQSAGSASNSQCTINGSGSSVSASGTQLTVKVAVTFQTSFAGTKNHYLIATDNEGLNSTWQPVGTWTVPAPQQYTLTTAVSPASTGTISPASGSYNSGTTVQVSASANSGYRFNGFSGALSGMTNPQNLVVNSTETVTASFVPIPNPTFTVTTSPPGLSLTVDGAACTSSCTYTWAAGTNHTVVTAAMQAAGGTQYVFSSWSDLRPLSHTITAPSSSATYTANFGARIPVYGGISPAQLEVNLGPLPVDRYDGIALNDQFPACPSGEVLQACMESLLSSYVIQGVTGVRFQLGLMGGQASTAFLAGGTVSFTWPGNLSNFFADLQAFGITRITPTLAMLDNWSKPGGPSGPTCAAYQLGCNVTNPQCTANGLPGKYLYFYPWLPFGFDPQDNMNADGRVDQGNQAYTCSPSNPNPWGWDKIYNLLASIAFAARSHGLTIEELDLQNEVDLVNFPVEARLIFDNTGVGAVFQYLAPALAGSGNPGVVTVSVNTSRPADTTNNYPCPSVYGDAAQVMESSELLAATGGAVIGFPFNATRNGELLCGGTTANPGNPNDPRSAMIVIPTQVTPTVTDVHAKPCLTLTGSSTDCNLNADATVPARDTFSSLWDFLWYRGLTANTVIFGETWSNSTKACNGYNDTVLTQQTINGYQQSCLSGNTACFVNGATPQAGVNPNPAGVVFRPWGDAVAPTSVCETPLNIGAPNGAFKQ